ncbi:flagellar FlbD family protein [Alteribacillus persepolensis]|uniref:flagellar FlbD family protein n=1 Tax=Alteribacillus persepolensis TaxID=568899 RepID=UPI000B80A36D|nr:flagellar FlbD family protein [Alteribacillus persepolensis]
MIELTKLNGDTFLLNVSFIEQVEALPDTTLTLHNGKKMVVKEDVKEVKQTVNAFFRRIGLMGIAIRYEEDK